MKYAATMGSGVMIRIPNFIKIGSSNHKLIGGIQTHRQHKDLIGLLLFYQNKEGRLQTENAFLCTYTHKELRKRGAMRSLLQRGAPLPKVSKSLR
jgi:hypothetical protein